MVTEFVVRPWLDSLCCHYAKENFYVHILKHQAGILRFIHSGDSGVLGAEKHSLVWMGDWEGKSFFFNLAGSVWVYSQKH